VAAAMQPYAASSVATWYYFLNTQQAAMSFRSSVGGDRPTALIVANESEPLQSGLQSIGWPFPVLKFDFEFIFQIKHTESIFIKQHSKTVTV